MADVSDVVSTIVGIVSGVIYPNGTSAPAVGGIDCRIFPGWPVPANLTADLAKGTCEISVYPWAGERNTTRYLLHPNVSVLNTPTLTLTASGQTVTVAGTIPPPTNPHNAVIFANGIPYGYAVQASDTLSTIASALATLINAKVPGTTSSGAVVTLPAGARLGAVRIGVTGTVATEIKRQEKQFHIIIWANDWSARAALAKLIDPALAALTFLTLPDLTGGRIRYVGNLETDNDEKYGCYRRDLIYAVEYPTIQSVTAPQVLAIGTTYQTPEQGTSNTYYQ